MHRGPAENEGRDRAQPVPGRVWWTQGALVAVLLVVAAWWLVFSQHAGSAIQVGVQATVALPIVVGLAVAARRVRAYRPWVVPLVAYALALPGLLGVWQDPPGPSAPGDEWCGAKGFVPMAVTEPLEAYHAFLPALGILLFVVGLAGLVRPAWRAPAGWLVMAGGTAFTVGLAALTCVGT